MTREDRNAAVERVIAHRKLREFIAKIEPDSIRDDLRQEIALALLTMPDGQLQAWLSRPDADDLVGYAIGIGWNLAFGKDSTRLQRRYHPHAEWTDSAEREPDEAPEDGRPCLADLEAVMSELPFFEAGVLSAIYGHCGGKAVNLATKTGIPYRAIQLAAKRGKLKLKSILCNKPS